MRKTKEMLLIFGLLALSDAYGLQTLNLKANESASAKISASELSRIFVDGDRIQSVRGLENTYELKSDNLNGEIYIKPTPEYKNRPFTIFLTTEEGRTFTLLLLPLGTPSENIVIKPKDRIRKHADKAGKWEMSSPYEETLVNLMVAMFNFSFSTFFDSPNFAEILDGFEVTVVPNARKERLEEALTVQLQIIYEGKRLRGEIYTVFNRKKTPITITESDFYSSGTRAIALRDHVLTGQRSTLLYVVKGINL